MGPFERRTTPPPPVTTTERTSWIPAPSERQTWPPPAPERQSWPPPGSSERPSWSSPPVERQTLTIPPPPANDTRQLRSTRPPATIPRGSGSPVSSERFSTGQLSSVDRSWFVEPPLRPGEGPFQIKGLAHRGLLHYVSHRVDGGAKAFSAALPSNALREFFLQPFLASSFYDLLPLATGSAVVAELTRIPLDVFAQQQGRSQASYDVQNAYRALLQGRTADDFHLRLRPLASRYYNFGEWDVIREEPGRLRTICKGIPSWLLPWFTPLKSGYFAGLVAAMGKPHSLVNVLGTKREGTAAGLPLTTLDLEIVLRD